MLETYSKLAETSTNQVRLSIRSCLRSIVAALFSLQDSLMVTIQFDS